MRKDSRLTSLSSLRPVDRSKSTPMTDQPSALCGLFCRTKGPHYSGKLSLSCPKVVTKLSQSCPKVVSKSTLISDHRAAVFLEHNVHNAQRMGSAWHLSLSLLTTTIENRTGESFTCPRAVCQSVLPTSFYCFHAIQRF